MTDSPDERHRTLANWVAPRRYTAPACVNIDNTASLRSKAVFDSSAGYATFRSMNS
jgi:hypothetical protein